MTNFDKKEFIRRVINGFSLTFLTLLLLLVMCGCKTQYVPVETVRTEYKEADTTAIYNRLLRIFESRKEKESQSDSLIDRMKETVVINEQGDTTRHDMEHIVYKATAREKELEQMLEQADRLLRDMHTQLLSVKSDSVPVPYPVERELTRWEKTKMDFGGAAIWGLGGALIAIGILGWMARKRR